MWLKQINKIRIWQTRDNVEYRAVAPNGTVLYKSNKLRQVETFCDNNAYYLTGHLKDTVERRARQMSVTMLLTDKDGYNSVYVTAFVPIVGECKTQEARQATVMLVYNWFAEAKHVFNAFTDKSLCNKTIAEKAQKLYVDAHKVEIAQKIFSENGCVATSTRGFLISHNVYTEYVAQVYGVPFERIHSDAMLIC